MINCIDDPNSEITSLNSFGEKENLRREETRILCCPCLIPLNACWSAMLKSVGYSPDI